MSRSVFEGKLKKAYKTCVKHTILDLGHALLTHHEATRIHKPHQCHPEGSREHLGASFGPSGNHLEVLWELLDTSWELSGSHLVVLWELSGNSWKPSSFSKTCFGRTIHQHPQPSQFNHKTSSLSLASDQKYVAILYPHTNTNTTLCVCPLRVCAQML